MKFVEEQKKRKKETPTQTQFRLPVAEKRTRAPSVGSVVLRQGASVYP